MKKSILILGANGFIDKVTTYDEYLADSIIEDKRKQLYAL